MITVSMLSNLRKDFSLVLPELQYQALSCLHSMEWEALDP